LSDIGVVKVSGATEISLLNEQVSGLVSDNSLLRGTPHLLVRDEVAGVERSAC